MRDPLSKITSLCKRKGFVYQNSEIYGGIAGFYDYGPLGVELKNNIKAEWWREMVRKRRDVVGIDGAIITHPRVWEASGHVESFTDLLVDCKKCRKRFRADHLAEGLGLNQKDGKEETGESLILELDKILKGVKCPDCGGDLTNVKNFNLMVEVGLGVVEGEKRKTFLRGEACQTIYLNYQNVLDSLSLKIPFGIAQIGKAFRNEITPKNFLYRQREFEQWDLQFFVNPKEMKQWYEYWKDQRMQWYSKLVNNKDNVRFRQHEENELAHYAKVAFDIEYKTPFGWKEWEGIHWRGNWDLSRHGEYANKDFTCTDPKTGEAFVPWIVETSGGVDRTFLFLLLDAFTEEELPSGGTRIVLKLNPRIAPFKAAVFPLLSNKEKLVEKADKVYQELIAQDLAVTWDGIGNIGKRYRRQDEIGTPWCITVDFGTLEDNTVTVRDRDTMDQIRVDANEIGSYIKKQLSLELS